MKKIIKSIALLFLLINLALTVQMAVVYAEDTDTLDKAKSPLEMLIEVGNESETGYSSIDHPDAPEGLTSPGVGQITSPLMYAIDFFKLILGGIALITIVIMAIRMISTDSDEEATKAKQGLILGIIGFVIIIVAEVFIKKVFFGEYGQVFESKSDAELAAKEGTILIRGLIGLFQAFIGAVAVLTIVVRGFTVITSAGDEESLTNAKKHILYAIAGLVVVGLSELVIVGFVFEDQGSVLPDVNKGAAIIAMITSYIAGFISILAFVFLVFAGYKYVVAAGNEEETEKVKKTIVGAVIALLLGLGAYAAINTLVELEPPQDTTEVGLEVSN